MITVHNLSYEYPGKQALKDISFTIAEGSVTALVGPNGAGKTTLLRCLAAIEEPFSGRIEVAGIDTTVEPRRIHSVLGYLSDFFGLYDDLTVKQCLTYAAWSHKLADDRVAAQVEKVAAQLELAPWLSHKVKSLSRGWRQRLGIAQAIIHDPKIVLLDEPASGLDPEARLALSGLFRSLQKQGMTLVVSSHILAELEDYCTDMLVLRDGAMVEHRQSGKTQPGLALRVTFAQGADKYLPLIAGFEGVAAPTLDGQTIRFRLTGGEERQGQLLKYLVDKGAPIKAFEAVAARLQDIYLSLGNKDKASDARQS